MNCGVATSRLPGFGDRLAALDGLATLDFNIPRIRIGGTKPLDAGSRSDCHSPSLVPGIGDDAAFGRFHGVPSERQYLSVVAARFKCLDDAPARGPAKFRIGSFGGRSARFVCSGAAAGAGSCGLSRRVLAQVSRSAPFWFCGYGS